MRDLQEELAAERLAKYYGGFVDPDSDYEVVSALTGKPIRVHNHKLIKDNNNKSHDEYNHNVSSMITGDIARVLWTSIIGAFFIVWISYYGWKVFSSKSARNKSRFRKSEEECKECYGTAKSSACPRAQNLFPQFERVRDRNSIYKKKNDDDDDDGVDELTYGEGIEKTCSGGPWNNHQSILRRRYPPQNMTTAPRARPPSSSPPSLVDEVDFVIKPNNKSIAHPPSQQSIPPPPQFSHQHTTSSHYDDDELLVSSTPTIHPTATTPARSSPITSTYDQSTEALVQHSSSYGVDQTPPREMVQRTPQQAQQTPQQIAQEFSERVHIIKQELLKSSSGNEEASSNVLLVTATQLAMLHQRSEMKHQHLQQKMLYHSRRDSNKEIRRYDDLLDSVDDLLSEVLLSIWNGIFHSVWVCLICEAIRHGITLQEQLQYFSLQLLGENLLMMACGCEEDAESEDVMDGSASSSFFSSAASFLLSGWDSSWNPSQSFDTLSSFASLITCMLGYFMAFGLLMLLHWILRSMKMPAFIHQVINFFLLVFYLAHNPSAWTIITDHIERYIKLTLGQAFITVATFAWAIWSDWSTRNYITKRHQQMCEAHNDGKNVEMTPCKAREKLSHLKQLAFYFAFLPPFLVGMFQVILLSVVAE